MSPDQSRSREDFLAIQRDGVRESRSERAKSRSRHEQSRSNLVQSQSAAGGSVENANFDFTGLKRVLAARQRMELEAQSYERIASDLRSRIARMDRLVSELHAACDEQPPMTGDVERSAARKADDTENARFAEAVLSSVPAGVTSLELLSRADASGFAGITRAENPRRAALAALKTVEASGRAYRTAGARYRLLKEYRS